MLPHSLIAPSFSGDIVRIRRHALRLLLPIDCRILGPLHVTTVRFR